MANEAGIWRLLLTARNEIPAAVEKDIAALNRLERKGAQTGGVLRKSMQKVGSAFGVGSALEGGTGVASSIGLGLTFAAAAGFRSMATAAMEADLSAQNAAESIRRQYRMTDAAVHSLNEISLEATKTTSVLKLALSEFMTAVFALNKLLVAVGLTAGIGVGKMMGIDMTATEQRREDLLVGMFQGLSPNNMGVGGSGEGGVATAEKMLADAEKERAENDAKRKATAPERRSASPLPVDDYARMGLFIGGRSTAAETTQLLRDQKRILEQVNRGIEQLAPRIADNL